MHEEKEIIVKSINEVICVCIEGKKELEYACKFALNTLSSTRVIGQAETHHSCLNLPLTICSESLVEVRISGWTKLLKTQITHGTLFLKKDVGYSFFEAIVGFYF